MDIATETIAAVTFFATLWTGFLAVTAPSSLAFIESHRVVNSAAFAMNASYKFVEKLFGKELLSGRAVLASLIFSLAFFAFAYFCAAASTEGLWAYSKKLYFEFDSSPNALGQYHNAAKLSVIALTTICLGTEVLYIVKSRLILRSLKMTDSYLLLIFRVILDIGTTLILFILIMPAAIMVALAILGLLHSGVDLTRVTVGPLMGPVVTPATDVVYSKLTFDDPIGSYANLSLVYFQQIVAHVDERFTGYHWLSVFPVVQMDGVSQLAAKRQTELEGLSDVVLKAGLVLPFTTMLATAFCTTIWVSATAACLMFIRLFCHTFRFGRTLFRFCHAYRELILWWGITASVVATVAWVGFRFALAGLA